MSAAFISVHTFLSCNSSPFATTTPSTASFPFISTVIRRSDCCSSSVSPRRSGETINISKQKGGKRRNFLQNPVSICSKPSTHKKKKNEESKSNATSFDSENLQSPTPILLIPTNQKVLRGKLGASIRCWADCFIWLECLHFWQSPTRFSSLQAIQDLSNQRWIQYSPFLGQTN